MSAFGYTILSGWLLGIGVDWKVLLYQPAMSPIKHLTTPPDLLSESKLDRDVPITNPSHVPITNPSQMTWDRLEQLLVIISGSAVLGSAIAEQTPLGGINGAIIGVVLGTIWGWYITHKSLHE
jgi:hypothetical protein